MIARILPYVLVFLGSFLLTYLLTPLVREMNRRLGMVDRPDPRRINKVPIPRGGGLALVIGIFAAYAAYHFASARPWLQGIPDETAYRMVALAVATAVLGLADDRWSLRPRTKLAGQFILAFLVWGWADLGFADVWPSLPVGVDCLLTVFWIVGAVNAFNLIDGLDGLAAGIALIATLGMAGSLFFVQNPQAALFYFAIAGALVAFLRYNYNPASVFLGDCGSMFLGFVIATLPLASHMPNSFMVSVGVPLLAMGVPIFDTALAILRRSLRHVLNAHAHGSSAGNDKVMTADSDHLHHRILRQMGMNQRKAAWTLYAMAVAAVVVGLVAMSLKSRAGGLWLLAVAAAAVVIFRDMAKIELYDAGRILGDVAHNRDFRSRRRLAKLTVPFFVAFDVLGLVCAYFVCSWALHADLGGRMVRVWLPLRVIAVFVALVAFRTYVTVWSRALPSNYFRLLLACTFGSVVASAIGYYAPYCPVHQLKAFTLAYAMLAFVTVLFVRMTRGLVRDLFYALDCARLKGDAGVSRTLVYGAGLRYRSFRSELVRTTAANDRMVVGLLDDDILLRGKYIGGIKILGTLADAPEIIRRFNVDAVVVACVVSDEWKDVIRRTLGPTGVKVTYFCFSEKEL